MSYHYHSFIRDDKLAKAVFVAGGLHDMGKLGLEFQKWLLNLVNKQKLNEEVPADGQHIDKGQFTWDKHARHNEISLILYQFFDASKMLPNLKLNNIAANSHKKAWWFCLKQHKWEARIESRSEG